MAVSIIKNFIAKQLFKQKGAIANNKSVEFSANALENRLKNLGIDPNAITSEKELNQILAYVKQAEDQAFQQGINTMLGGSKFDRKGEVFDMSGKKLDSSQGIMGGTQINEQTLKEGLMKTDNPFSDLVKTTEKGPKTLAEREAEVLARLEKENKAAAQRIRDRKRLEDRAIEDFVDDAGGVNPDDPRGIDDFIPDPEDMAQGGRVGLMAGSVPKIFKLLKDPKKVKQAIDNIFPTGDVKYDATMAAESLVELNPKFFGNKLYDDLDSMTRLDIYDAVISPMMSAQAKALKMKKITKPEKTLQSMKEGKGINMSDPEIAKEFEQFMKQTDPEGVKKLEQTLELDNFDPKGRKKNATGGRAGFDNGGAPSITLGPKEGPMGPVFETNDPGEAAKEIIRRLIKVEGAQIPLTEKGLLSLNVDNLDKQSLGGIVNLLGGELQFGIGKDKKGKGAGFTFRKQFKEGSGMTRRTFLKLLGGMAAIPIVGKFLKPVKTAKGIKSVPMIKTGDVPGKPEWFDALVNKVILEGDDVTKRFATQERQVVHMKKIDDDTSVTVTQDLNDGSIIVDVDDPIRNVMGESGQDTSVQMMLKKGQADEMTKGTPADEFSFTENDMRNYMDGPDDYTTEFVENTVDKMSDLTSDLGKIKSYATGKGPTMKQIVESKKRKDMVKFAEKNPSEYAANRGPEFDPDYDDYASGGIARMLGE
jgi:hypothetical protein